MANYPTRKTKNGTVVDVRFRIVDENGMEVQKRLCGYPNKRAAQQAYLEFMKTYSPPALKVQKVKSYLFDDLWKVYRKKKETELAVSSFYDLNWIFDKFLSPFFSGKSLPELKKSDYAEWQTELWASKNPKTSVYYTQKYLTKIRSTLLAFLTWCEETYDILNQYKMVRKPKRKEMKREMNFWEIEQFLKFQETIDDIMWKTFFMCLFYSGCRVGEIIALNDHDVVKEKQNYILNINKGLTRKTMQTDDKYVISAPKTLSSNRSVTLPNIMTEQIDIYFAYKNDNNIPSTFFFGGDKPIRQRTYQRYFLLYTDKSELPHIRIHDLRHSHASMLIHLNVPITVVSKRLGHSSVKMTLERYSHCYSDGENVAISAIDSAVGKEECSINAPQNKNAQDTY